MILEPIFVDDWDDAEGYDPANTALTLFFAFVAVDEAEDGDNDSAHGPPEEDGVGDGSGDGADVAEQDTADETADIDKEEEEEEQQQQQQMGWTGKSAFSTERKMTALTAATRTMRPKSAKIKKTSIIITSQCL